MFTNCILALSEVFNIAVIIFMIVCKLNPKLLENEKVNWIYEFVVGYREDEEELYEIA